MKLGLRIFRGGLRHKGMVFADSLVSRIRDMCDTGDANQNSINTYIYLHPL